MKHYFLIVSLFLLAQCSAQLSLVGTPSFVDSSAIVKHNGFTLEYSEQHEQARWVAYMLTAERVNGPIARADNFRADPLVATGSAELTDYKNSGYDRGHLFPAGDAKYDAVVMDECFYLSNMSPQNNAFNGGVWERLESQVRKWSLQYDTLYIATAGILTDGLPAIGSNKVSVPLFFYKVIYSPKMQSGIGFIIKNEESSKDLATFALSIDSVESMTSIDFFRELPDNIENVIEKEFDKKVWFLSSGCVQRIVKPYGHQRNNENKYDLNGRKVSGEKKTSLIRMIY